MALTLDEVRGIATLARLRLSPDEEARFVPQLGRIVEYIGQLASYELYPAPERSAGSVEAADRVAEPLSRELFLANAPEAMDGFLVVPQVKGDGDA